MTKEPFVDAFAESLAFECLFDEDSGHKAKDSVAGLDYEIAYQFLNPKYLANPVEPSWKRDSAVSGSCLSFDGNSSCIEVADFSLNGSSFTVDVFAAPRFFEHDIDSSAFTTNEIVTTIVANCNKSENKGFILGYLQYGRVTFQVGTGDSWIKVYSDICVNRYEWTHISAVFDGENGQISLYLNGELHGNASFSGGKTCADGGTLFIAKNPDYKRLVGGTVYDRGMFGGLLDELRIYSIPLQEGDIAERHRYYCQDGKLEKEAKFEDVWLDSDILAEDLYKPVTHASPPQNWMNESHGLIWFNGYYHLFYQFNISGPYWGQIIWGHWVSTDLVNWMDVKEAVVSLPDTAATDGIWSGDATYDGNGNPVLVITAGNEDEKGSKQNVAFVRPKDLNDPFLTEWIVEDVASVKQTNKQGVLGQFRDPQVWQDGDTWYMLVGGSKANGQHGTAYVYTTTDTALKQWQYQGELYTVRWEGRPWYDDSYGTCWELPNLLPLNYENGDFSGKYIFSFNPCGGNAKSDITYWIGTFDKETCTFTPDFKEARVLDLWAQSYCTPRMNYDKHSNRVLVNSAIASYRTPAEMYQAGWANCLGYIREICLSEDGGRLIVKRVQELDHLIGEELLSYSSADVKEINTLLSDISCDTGYVKLTAHTASGKGTFGLSYKINLETGKLGVVSYQAERQTITADLSNSGNLWNNKSVTAKAPYDGDEIMIEFFIDKSVTEIYIDGKSAMTLVMYNLGDGLKLFARNGIDRLDIQICELNPITRKTS